ncbi:hypothetical protein AVEN_5375-1 [Araneus ventricosus]|uniref:Uncharacterized protein n=1 Tax=Araneus ventricosus TaxID=182803 RepID=A0A4Y2X3Z6_ARAVE|nr:hypothetical protein AVEN_5375-1 [Araneus ventricosus]
MAASYVESRIVFPFKPTFSDMSLAKTAIALFSEFNIQILWKAFSELVYGNLPELESSSEHSPSLLNRVKEKILLVPTNLRHNVWEAVERVQEEVRKWMHDHRYVPGLDHTKFPFFWRSDGTIDRAKTAQDLVGNQTIDIKTRFEIACKYCLVNSVQTLWAELEAISETENFETPYNGIVYFWVTWMREASHVPWAQFAHEHLDPQWFLLGSVPRFTSLFQALMPGCRGKFFKYLYLSDDDDIRFCLYTVTQEEQETIMTLLASRVLGIHMQWPLASLFLETAEKAWKFLNNSSYFNVLMKLLSCENVKDIDYEYLAVEFWKHSPCQFKENAKSSVRVSEKLKFLEERRMKRKAVDADGGSYKRFKKYV